MVGEMEAKSKEAEELESIRKSSTILAEKSYLGLTMMISIISIRIFRFATSVDAGQSVDGLHTSLTCYELSVCCVGS